MLAREGIVTMKALKMVFRLLAFLTRRKTLQIRKVRITVVYEPMFSPNIV